MDLMEDTPTAIQTIFATLQQGITGMITAVTSMFDFITSTDVLPWFAIGIVASLVLFGVKIVRRVVWGA